MSAAMSGQLIITGMTVLICVVVGGVALAALWVTRRASIRYPLVIAALTPLVAVGATVAMNVRLMFLSRHDSGVMMLALTVSLVLAAAFALMITRTIATGASRLGAGISGLASDQEGRRSPARRDEPHLPAELARVMGELETTQARLVEARAREQAALQARQQLVQHLSHDLRTPLAGLRAMTEALEDGMVTDVPQAMRQLRTTVGRMDSLVGDLFDLSRLQDGRRDREHLPLSVRELLTDLVDEAETAANRNGIDLLVDLPENDRLAVSGDADDLARAVGNLISNAVRHTVAGGTVVIAAGRGHHGAVEIAVSDRCGGIPTADLPRIFDPGWRGDQSRTAQDGAGLGLAIARGVVESHRGRISARNVSAGCTFEVVLPGLAGFPAPATTPTGLQ